MSVALEFATAVLAGALGGYAGSKNGTVGKIAAILAAGAALAASKNTCLASVIVGAIGGAVAGRKLNDAEILGTAAYGLGFVILNAQIAIIPAIISAAGTATGEHREGRWALLLGATGVIVGASTGGLPCIMLAAGLVAGYFATRTYLQATERHAG